MINRAALILKLKQPAIDWINEVDSYRDAEISKEEALEERTVYLIDDESAENLDEMLKNNFEMFFEHELLLWYTDESLWPEELSYEMFKEWFEVECHSVVENVVDGPILEEDF